MALRTPAFNDAKSYGFEWLRYLVELGAQEGVIGTGMFKVTAAAAGGMRVDVAAGVAAVKGDSGIAALGLTQGLFLVVNDAAIANAVTVAASHATLPRVDQIILRVKDSSDLGTLGDVATLEVLTGTPTSGATEDNRLGAVALPNDCLRLADMLIPAASVAVLAGNVRDRRLWARGFRCRIQRGVNVTYSTTSTTYVLIDAAVSLRAELPAGHGIRLSLMGTGAWASGAGASAALLLDFNVDGAQILGAAGGMFLGTPANNLVQQEAEPVPGAGSHIIYPTYAASAGATVRIDDTTANPLVFTAVEDLRSSGHNLE